MMAAEGTFLAAVIARLPDPKHNLAAFGVAFSLAVFAESPILMITGASTALVMNVGDVHKNISYWPERAKDGVSRKGAKELLDRISRINEIIISRPLR